MSTHVIGTREEWLTARLELLAAEKELTRRSDELALRRQALPWVRVDKAYRFDSDEGEASLADLFRGRSQLLVYHFMFGPDYAAGCATCSTIADGFDGFVVHLAHHDVTLAAVSRTPLAKLQAYKRRMGWRFPWASAHGSDFNFDFNVSFTEEQQRTGNIHYNYQRGEHAMDATTVVPPVVAANAAMTDTDVRAYTRERPGMSAFVREDGVVYHTYSTYARGLDGLWGMYQWLDRAPRAATRPGASGGGATTSTSTRRDERWPGIRGRARSRSGRGRAAPRPAPTREETEGHVPSVPDDCGARRGRRRLDGRARGGARPPEVGREERRGRSVDAARGHGGSRWPAGRAGAGGGGRRARRRGPRLTRAERPAGRGAARLSRGRRRCPGSGTSG